MPVSKELSHLRACHANARLRGDAVAAAQFKRDMTALKIEEYIARVVAEAPPLTEQQRNRLAAILRTPAGGRSA